MAKHLHQNRIGYLLAVPKPHRQRQCSRGHRTLDQCTRQNRAPHGDEFAEVVAQADPEDQQNRPDLGELLHNPAVCDKARSQGADRTWWKDADPDLPVLIAAKAEYQKLP